MRLHRYLRAVPSERRRARFPPRRGRARTAAGPDGGALSGRELRLGLPLGGRRRTPRAARALPGPGMADHRAERGGCRRVPPMVRTHGPRADDGGQSRDPRGGRGGGARRVLQRGGRQPVGRPAGRERAGRAVRREAVVPRQRNGRAVAGRAQGRGRLRQAGRGCRPGDEAGRPVDRAGGLRVVLDGHADVRLVGAHGALALHRGGRPHIHARVLRAVRR